MVVAIVLYEIVGAWDIVLFAIAATPIIVCAKDDGDSPMFIITPVRRAQNTRKRRYTLSLRRQTLHLADGHVIRDCGNLLVAVQIYSCVLRLRSQQVDELSRQEQ